MSTESDRFSSYTYGEGKTGIGQMVNFTCRKDFADKVSEFLKENVRTVDIPTTKRVNISHGGYGQYTRYNVVQHDYAGGGPGEGGGWGYIEVLEIKDPPDGHWGIVINERNSLQTSAFTEWETIEDAREAFKQNWGSRETAEVFPKLKGFKRFVHCGILKPWFYAIGDEQLLGDYAFPDGLQDDPVYCFGRQFVVYDDKGIPSVKTCMGTRFIKIEQYHNNGKNQYSRLVYWEDGGVWDETGCHPWWSTKFDPPRPIEEGELWVTEAVRQFRQLLAGKSTEFSINFTDGNKFTGRLIKSKSKILCDEGEYFVIVHVKDVKEPKRGLVNFKPTPEAPDVVQFVTQRLAAKGEVVERIEVKEKKTEVGGKKWAGAFFNRPQ